MGAAPLPDCCLSPFILCTSSRSQGLPSAPSPNVRRRVEWVAESSANSRLTRFWVPRLNRLRRTTAWSQMFSRDQRRQPIDLKTDRLQHAQVGGARSGNWSLDTPSLVDGRVDAYGCIRHQGSHPQQSAGFRRQHQSGQVVAGQAVMAVLPSKRKRSFPPAWDRGEVGDGSTDRRCTAAAECRGAATWVAGGNCPESLGGWRVAAGAGWLAVGPTTRISGAETNPPFCPVSRVRPRPPLPLPFRRRDGQPLAFRLVWVLDKVGRSILRFGKHFHILSHPPRQRP